MISIAQAIHNLLKGFSLMIFLFIGGDTWEKKNKKIEMTHLRLPSENVGTQEMNCTLSLT